jgi:hypothetical protein
VSNATQFFPKGVEAFKKEYRTELLAVKALHSGTASERQQQIALAFIVKTICRADEFNYFSESDRDTAFALGREAVGKVLRGFAIDSSWTNGDKK